MRMFENIDCMEGMKDMPDNYADLAICDPPYGIDYKWSGNGTIGKANKAPLKQYHIFNDEKPPNKRYFDELIRISKNQIICGGQHFTDKLYTSPAWIIWDKEMTGGPGIGFTGMELAWTSFKHGLRKFRYRWNGMLQENMSNKETRIHPTQKPIALYRWLLENYAKPGDLILDTHVGSASSLIACEALGFDYVGYEIDKDYYQAAKKRLEDWRSMPLFDAPEKEPEQIKLDY